MDMGDFTPGTKPKGGFFREGGMGRTIAGLIGDALLQNADMAPVYAPMQRQRQQTAQEEAQWHRRREAERADKQWEWANKPKDDDGFTSMMRAAGIDPNSDAGRAFYAQRLQRQVAEPDVITTLPNGQLYAGPRSGLAAALTGQTAPIAKPVGKLTPIAGGPTPPASGSFR